jgi:hypothetical protein
MAVIEYAEENCPLCNGTGITHGYTGDLIDCEHRAAVVDPPAHQRTDARAERRAEFEAALDELITSARIHGQGLERLGWKIIQGVATAAGMRIEADEYVTVEGDRARVLALWDAKEA